MIKKQNIIIAFFLILGINVSAQEDQEEYSTFNEEMAIGIEGDSIAVYALIASGKEIKETVIFLHGIPGNERNLDLAQDVRRSGRNAIFFSYRGAWGSQGTYSYSNCLADIGHVLDFFSDTAIISKMRIDTSRFVLMGHSLGGGLALIQGANENRVKKIIALSAANYGYWLREVTSIDSLQGFQNYIRSSFMLNCNPREFVQELLDHKTEYSVLTYSSKLASKKVLIIDDDDWSHEWAGELKDNAEYKVIESDHSFTNKRKELSDYIIAWLEKTKRNIR